MEEGPGDSRVYEIDHHGWNRTHDQCHAGIKFIHEQLTPQVAENFMAEAPKVKDLELVESLVKADEQRARSWRLDLQRLAL